MEVFDLLTERDKKIIGGYVSTYGDYGGDALYYRAPVEDILRYWNGAKSGYLASIMGNQLILERRINIQTPESIIWEQLEDVMCPNGKEIPFIKNYRNWQQKFDYNLYDLTTQLIDIDCLSKNSYLYDNFEIPVGDSHPIQVINGCKIMKILGKIARTFKLDGFEEFRLKHSMILNQQRFQGTLCLSIHPLDYMTMSDNNCHWNSCMSWMKPGEYREGTVEMMNSPYVIVAYLRAEENMYLFPYSHEDKVEWNNKRWRELFVVSPDVITGIRGYPYDDSILQREVFNWLQELAQKNCPWVHYDAPITFSPGETFDYHDKGISVGFGFHIMYDDFGYDHIGYFAPTILNKLNNYGHYSITLSGENVCMSCGKVYPEYDKWDTQNLCCPSCSGEIRCEHCGNYINEEDVTWVGDDALCDYCAERCTQDCAYCGDANYIENTEPIYLTQNGELTSEDPFYVCDCCRERAQEDKLNSYFGKINTIIKEEKFWRREVNAIEVEDLTLNGFRAFGYYTRTIEEAREYFKTN